MEWLPVDRGGETSPTSLFFTHNHLILDSYTVRFSFK